jgi:hypothetical protein
MSKLVFSTMLFFMASLPRNADASTFTFSLVGPGVRGTINLTYGAAPDAKYPQAFEVTGLTGTFSDSNKGLNLVNVPIGPLEPIKHDTPEPDNLLAPNDFSRFAVSTGLGPDNHGFLTYDNLIYPGGSPPTATDYTVHGGFLDIYGLMFDIGSGRVVNLWSNGDFSMTGTGPIDYGVAVANHDMSLNYVSDGVSIIPEPNAVILFVSGLIGILVWRRKSALRPILN